MAKRPRLHCAAGPLLWRARGPGAVRLDLPRQAGRCAPPTSVRVAGAAIHGGPWSRLAVAGVVVRADVSGQQGNVSSGGSHCYMVSGGEAHSGQVYTGSQVGPYSGPV